MNVIAAGRSNSQKIDQPYEMQVKNKVYRIDRKYREESASRSKPTVDGVVVVFPTVDDLVKDKGVNGLLVSVKLLRVGKLFLVKTRVVDLVGKVVLLVNTLVDVGGRVTVVGKVSRGI